MAKRVLEEPCNIPLYIRVSDSMKKAVDSAADKCQLSTSEWLRRAVSRELERENSDRTSFVAQDQNGNDVEFVSIEDVETIVRRILKEELSKTD